MKLNDNKFSKSPTVKSVKKSSRQEIKEAFNPSSSIEALFDKLAQVEDIMQPELGVAPERPAQWISKFPGMAQRNDIKKRVRELCKLGYDSPQVLETLSQDRLLGEGANSPAVKLWIDALCLFNKKSRPSDYESEIFKRGMKLEAEIYVAQEEEKDASLVGDTLSKEEIPGTGKIGTEVEYDLPKGPAIGVDPTQGEHSPGITPHGRPVPIPPVQEINLSVGGSTPSLDSPAEYGVGQRPDNRPTPKPLGEPEFDFGASKSAQVSPGSPPTPPAAPGGTPQGGPVDVGIPETPPEDIMESELTLDEALEQLEESSKAVVEKVQKGETVLNGEDVEPVDPMDTGAKPAPAPKIVGAAKNDPPESDEDEPDDDPEKPEEDPDEEEPEDPEPEKKEPEKKPEDSKITRMKDLQEKIKQKEGPKTPEAPRGFVPKAPKTTYARERLMQLFPKKYQEILDTCGPDVQEQYIRLDEVKDMYPIYKEKLPRNLLLKVEQIGGGLQALNRAEFDELYGVLAELSHKSTKRKIEKEDREDRPDRPKKDPHQVKNEQKPGMLPHNMSKEDLRKFLTKYRDEIAQKTKRGSREAVDQDAKNYWHDLFGEYGDEMTKDVDRLANVVDLTEETFEYYGTKLDPDKFNKIVAFMSDDTNVEVGSIYSAVSHLASRDSEFANLIDRMMLDYMARVTEPTHSEFPGTIKSAMFIMATDDCGVEDDIMTYIGQKMKTPKPDGQLDDAVKVEEWEDEAEDSEQERQSYLPKFEVDDCFIKNVYTHLVIKWDTNDKSLKDKSDEGLKQAVLSYVKSLEGDKEFEDCGYFGQINIVDEEWDPEAGVAECYFRTKKPSDAVNVVGTEPKK